MAGVKISALPAVATAALTDIFPVVQAGVTSKETLQQAVDLFGANIQIDESQVNNLLTDLAARLQLAGGTMTGTLTLAADPAAALQAATKQYVDSVAEGLHFHPSCDAATTANLAGYTYNNGASGVGATLTNTVNGAFSTDGVSPALNARILVAFQSAQTQNGIYVLTQVGDGSNPAILTRALDYDQPAEIDVGDAVIVETGTLYAGTIWFQTAVVTTIGVSNIVFTLTNSAANINAGTGLTKSGNTISLINPVIAALGGTGVNNGTNTITLGDDLTTGGIFTTAGDFETGGDFEMAGAFNFTGTVTGNTTVTFPTSGTLATTTAIGRLIGVQAFTTTGTWTPTAGTTTAILFGSGGGAGGSGSGTASSGGLGGAGGDTSVDAILVAKGAAAPATVFVGGAGGLASASTGTLKISGGHGGDGSATGFIIGGMGANSFFGGGGGAANSEAGWPGTANSGGGGAGGGTVSGSGSGSGGGAGAFAVTYHSGVTGTYAVTIGAGGSAGTAGTTGFAGGAGGSGVVLILEFT